MEILSILYSRCEPIENWNEAEELATEYLEYMDFTDIEHLSKKDAVFPFDYSAIGYGEKCLIDVTLRFRKAVRTKRLDVWRSLGYKTLLLIIISEQTALSLGTASAILINIEPSDNWVGISHSKLEELDFDKEMGR